MMRTGVCSTIGGKSLLCKRIAAHLDRIPHVQYVEPFCGAASVYLAKKPARWEVLNDINGEVVALLRVCARHPKALIEQLQLMHAGRADFNWLARLDPSGLTDIERAARWWYVSMWGYCSKRGGVFNTKCGTRSRGHNWEVQRYSKWLAVAAPRLRDAAIECLPWQEAIRRFDKPHTLYYCDPPYIGTTGYATPFGEADHRQLAAALHNIRGRFVLSLNNCPLAKELYADCRITTVKTKWLAGTKGKLKLAPVRELLIFGPPRAESAMLDARSNTV